MKTPKNLNGGLVYSTNPDFAINNPQKPIIQSVEPNAQNLRVLRNQKLKAGKIVTLVTGFQGTDEDLEKLGKKLKAYLGTGGTVKEGEIQIQGDFWDRIFNWLIKEGYKAKKSGG